MISYLSVYDLLSLAQSQGWGPVRDAGLLESAAARPQSSVFQQDAYPTIDLKAAALLESLVRNHPLVDGNKRLGWLSCAVFYRLNGYRLRADQDEAYDLVIAITAGHVDLAHIARSLAQWRVQDA